MEHQNHAHKGHNSHAGHGMSHGSAEGYLKRFWIVTVLLVPLLLAQPKVAAILGVPLFSLNNWVQFALATAIFSFALVFFKHAWHEIKAREFGMMTLVALAVGSGYLFSVASTFVAALDAQFYLEISTLVWVLLFGHYLEAKSSSAAGDALSEVAKLLPKQAHKLEGKVETDVDVTELKVGDTVIIKPGEKVPADGEILTGAANVDEALISGESKPVEKKAGMPVVAGSICLDGSLTVRLTRVGEQSTVGQIKTLVMKAGMSKPRSQKIADRAAAVLTFAALVISLSTLLVWTLIVGETFTFAATLAITVLVIACPHALGLAIPAVTTIATTLAVRGGFFIKDLSKIETIRQIDYVVFDKTGTLTKGEFGVVKIEAVEGESEDKILSLAASLERRSSHVIGTAITSQAQEQNLPLSEIEKFQNIAGMGVKAVIDGVEYFAGNDRLMQSLNLKSAGGENEAGTVVYVAKRDKLLGHIILADSIKPSAYEAVRQLHEMDVKVAMLTGDNQAVAESVAKELGIDTYFAEVMPEDKYRQIKDLQVGGHVVLMVGDGVNDAPALKQANVGVAIGAGTDIAAQACDVILTNNNPEDIARLIKLSKVVYSKMLQNLVWALGYNLIAIPAAAGAFAVFGFFLRPEIGALAMSLSTVIVVINAMSLRRIRL